MSHGRSAIAIRHVAFEDLGLLGPILKDSGWNVAYREAAFGDLDDPAIGGADLLIVLGGPIGVYETDAYPFLSKEIALLEKRLAKNLPILGICLGSQLIASALGARVYAGPVKEIGWGKVALTPEGVASCLAPLGEAEGIVLHWHGDTFDLPAGATRLAFNGNYENQAFSYGNTLALQFHAEADPRRLGEWYVGHTVELAAIGISVPELRARTKALAARAEAQAARIFTKWLRELETASPVA